MHSDARSFAKTLRQFDLRHMLLLPVVSGAAFAVAARTEGPVLAKVFIGVVNVKTKHIFIKRSSTLHVSCGKHRREVLEMHGAIIKPVALILFF